ncbi:MAG: AraC family transcriptional regulator [Oscillospiraceae bacterium]|nr:AraC family transcriptional regulator [Oscillospiraceae bacterium]
MPELVTLEHFDAQLRHYHIYRIRNSPLDHQAHCHNYFQVCLVTCGQILHCQEGQSVPLGPGDVFIIPPGMTHHLHFDDPFSELYSLAFDLSLFHPGFPRSNAYRFLTELQSGAPGQSVHLRVVPGEAQRAGIQSLMDCLIRQQQEETAPSRLSAAPSLISSILYLLAQSYYQQSKNSHRMGELAEYNTTLVECTRYIDEHFARPLDLTTLARQFGLSRSTLCAIFPQFTGLSPHRYIAKKRIEAAQLIIRSEPELSLAQVAARVGYEEFSTFYRTFLRLTGLSPSKYRKLYTSAF